RVGHRPSSCLPRPGPAPAADPQRGRADCGADRMRAACGFALLLGVTTVARAELPSPRLDRLFPLGAAAGATVEVEVQGADLDGAKTLLFDHPGLRAEFIKDRFFRITVAKEVPAGTYDVRLVGRWGVSNPRLLAVSHGLTEIAEKEPNDSIEQAQPVPVNCAVNGTSD